MSSWWSASSSWEQREPHWNRAEAESDQPWERSWTPENRAPKSAQHDWKSPTGFKHTTGLPDNFVQSKSYLDSREIYGKTLLRKIAATSWSSKYGLAGQSMEQVKLVDLLWRGWHNQHLRALSHGSYVSLLVARKVNEAVFSQALLTIIREKKWDLDDLAHQFCKVQNIADPPKSHPTSEAVKVHKAQALAALAKFLGDQLESFASNMSSSSNPDKQEIESLRAQLEAEKARNMQSANSSQPAKRRRLLEKQEAPLPFVIEGRHC